MYLERYAHAFNQPKKELSAKIQKNFDKVFGLLDISGPTPAASQTAAEILVRAGFGTGNVMGKIHR